MIRTTITITSLLFALFSCSEKGSRVTIQDTFENGQAKTTIYKTIDDKNSYYKITYDSLGRIKEIIPYSDGKINGTQIYFRDNLEVVGLLAHKGDKRHGFTYEFHKGLQTAFKGEAIDGEFNGLSTWFHKNGKVEETGIRTNGQKEGEWTEYYENEQIKSKGTYVNGIKQNDWKFWNIDGTIDTTKHD